MNIVITGSSRGIGFATTIALCKMGHNVIAISRNNEKLEQLKMKCLDEHVPGSIYTLNYDLTCMQLENNLPNQILNYFKSIDILINNAGALINKPFQDFTINDFDSMFDINVKSVFRVVQALMPYFNTKAHIVNIGSMGGFQGSVKFSGLSLYSASKGALAILTECMAEEFKDKNIKANCLALGAAQTEMLAEAFPGYKAPLEASEIAEFIADFSLNGHRFINGKTIPVSLSTP